MILSQLSIVALFVISIALLIINIRADNKIKQLSEKIQRDEFERFQERSALEQEVDDIIKSFEDNDAKDWLTNKPSIEDILSDLSNKEFKIFKIYLTMATTSEKEVKKTKKLSLAEKRKIGIKDRPNHINLVKSPPSEDFSSTKPTK